MTDIRLNDAALIAVARKRVETFERAALWGKPHTGASLIPVIKQLIERLEENDAAH